MQHEHYEEGQSIHHRKPAMRRLGEHIKRPDQNIPSNKQHLWRKNQKGLTHLEGGRLAGQERLAQQTLFVPQATSYVAKRISVLNSLPKVVD